MYSQCILRVYCIFKKSWSNLILFLITFNYIYIYIILVINLIIWSLFHLCNNKTTWNKTTKLLVCSLTLSLLLLLGEIDRPITSCNLSNSVSRVLEKALAAIFFKWSNPRAIYSAVRPVKHLPRFFTIVLIWKKLGPDWINNKTFSARNDQGVKSLINLIVIFIIYHY